MNKEEQKNNAIIPEPKAEMIAVETVEDLISIAQKRMEVVPKLIEMALKVTNYRDWVDQDGEPYLVHSGAEKVARLFGAKMFNIQTLKEWAEDTKGRYYIYKTTGTWSLPGTIDSIEAIGTCSQRDGFFAKAKGEWLDSLEIDETNIMKASYSNFVVNGITHLLGLRNLTWDQVIEAGIDQSKVLKIGYQKGSQKVTKTLTKEAVDKRKQIYDMALQMAGGNEEEIKVFIKQESLFTVKDRNGNDQEKFAETVEQLTTEKWINMTHKKMKEAFKRAYPQEALPFKEEEEKK